MRKSSTVSAWAPFIIASLLTIVVHETLWAKEQYWYFLSILGVVSVALGGRVLRQTGLKNWPVIGVVLGLITGQWWFIEFATMQVLWTFNGFVR